MLKNSLEFLESRYLITGAEFRFKMLRFFFFIFF